MAEIDKSVEYWRDQVSLLLKSGTAIITLFAGWAINHHEEFYVGRGASILSDPSVAALGLLAMSFVYAVFLPVSIASIYAEHLDQAKEPTLVPKKVAMRMAYGLAWGGLLIAALMSFR